jgi:hypothetical protein
MSLLPVPIPSGYIISVKVDQKISQGDIIASSENQNTSSDLVIEIAKDLEADPKKISKIVIKNLGDRIEIGDIIAKKGGVFGSSEVRSKVSGTLTKLDEDNGTITIKTSQASVQDIAKNIISPVDGEVSVCDNDKVVLKTDKEAILAEASSGETSFGEALYLEKGEPEIHDIEGVVSGKILIAKVIDREVISKAIGLGAVGIIGQEISDVTLENLRSKKINTPVLRVSEENFKKIAKKNEKIMLDSINSIIIKL